MGVEPNSGPEKSNRKAKETNKDHLHSSIAPDSFSKVSLTLYYYFVSRQSFNITDGTFNINVHSFMVKGETKNFIKSQKSVMGLLPVIMLLKEQLVIFTTLFFL